MSNHNYGVAVYIKVGAGWWTKHYWATTLTTIQSIVNWVCDITTGKVDQEATEIVAYLVPASYNPPLMSGGPSLPFELDQNAIAKVLVTRTPFLISYKINLQALTPFVS